MNDIKERRESYKKFVKNSNKVELEKEFFILNRILGEEEKRLNREYTEKSKDLIEETKNKILFVLSEKEKRKD